MTKDNQRILSGSLDKTARSWDANNGNPLLAYPAAGAGPGRRREPPTTSRWSSARPTAPGRAFDLAAPDAAKAEKQAFGTATAGAGINAVAVLPDNVTFATASDDKAVKLWTLAAPGASRTFAGQRGDGLQRRHDPRRQAAR